MQDGGSLESVFDRVHTSVVTIQTIGRTAELDDSGMAVLAGGLGSGVLVSRDGKIMTAAHVVQSAEQVQVQFVDGSILPARILGTVPVADLALLQVEGNLPDWVDVAPLAKSSQARVGSRVFAIGSPRGIAHTLTVGYVSARRVMEVPLACRCPVDLIQTDAAINKGNSPIWCSTSPIDWACVLRF